MKTKTIQSNLFLTYSLIIIIVLAVFVSFFYVWVSNVLKEKAFEAINNLSDSFVEKLDYEVHKLDTVSMNILYSNLVKEKFKEYLSYGNYDGASGNSQSPTSSDAVHNASELVDMLVAINGPSIQVQQIYLYDFEGNRFGTGFDNRQYSTIKDNDSPISNTEWYKEVMEKKGKKVIPPPYKDPELSDIISLDSERLFISMYRMYSDNYNVTQGIVEVIQYYDTVFANIIDHMSKNPGRERVYVYDTKGRLYYPSSVESTEDSQYYYNFYRKAPQNKDYCTVRNPVTNEKELLVYKYSEFSGWIVAVVISENQLLSPVFAFTKIVIMVAFFILLLALLFSFFAARKYTTPIATLRKIIRSMDLHDPSTKVPENLNSGLNELEELNQAFHKMNIKLKKSVEDLLLSQQHEMQSKMLALQSQMNPHFLFNTLATISVMAEEKMDEQIVEMCGYISDMLRYISSDSSQLVHLKSELEYTEKYLACMKIRHGNKLSYSIEILNDGREISIPKLIIQPLVENALKYGTHLEPPWNIRITGYVSNNYWEVNVLDNGDGFDAARLDAINKEMQEIDQSGLLPNLELEGMGLLNIYIRLKLIYKNQMTFKIAENPDGGAIVTIGGIT